MIDLGGDDKGRCCLVIQRNGRPYQCGLRPLHKGDCEPLDTGPAPRAGEAPLTPYGEVVLAREDAARALIDAIAVPAGRDFTSAWETACMLFGRFDAKPKMFERRTADAPHPDHAQSRAAARAAHPLGRCCIGGRCEGEDCPCACHPPVRSGGKVRLPAGLPAGGLKAYCRGAIDYATGRGLDRLARDLGTARGSTESDHDLSRRLAVMLGAP